MSQEAVPERTAPEHPKGLLQQMEELMAALTADLSQLDADLQSSADRLPSPDCSSGTPPTPDTGPTNL
ncbi:hypothetical protein AMK26_15475 [Streptomyces sp. CB03234]|uniref:hypothetical protein n=1 Tax=Streptomyces sp. (strain CB03234) TaxID=1703937 RepID=UPI0009398016|nr:hypothetical protein [Streptomyces sp. CB03234]OKK04707.1 hypothetical protein AMK26_15475 [Streptomyces sp. CB03234]